MNVLMISPGFPAEMPYFTRGLAQVGARVLGLGDQPPGALPEVARNALADYLQVRNLWDETAVIDQVRQWARHTQIERVECQWEPAMLLAARLRETLSLPGMTVAETIPFRNKERMKQVLDAAGVRTPRHARAVSADQVRAAAEQIGFPLIVKPIAGAGSADTYRLGDRGELEGVLPRIRHVPEVSVEEFVEGDEYTFDTICSHGQMHYCNIAWYRPNVLVGRSEEWVSPQTITLRNLEAPELASGRALGLSVLKALGFRTGLTHMEWFRKANGEAVFGEIAARPPGARSVELMNYGCDLDVYTGWAEAVCHNRFSQTVHRRHNAAVIFKRARGQGRIQRIEGLERLLHDFGEHVVVVNLAALGAPRRNWRQTLISDGYIILRHPDLATTVRMADRVGSELTLYAG